MATIKKKIDVTKKPTARQKKMLEELEQRPIVYDDDCPELTEEQLAQFKRISDIRREEGLNNRKQNVTLRLSPQTLKKARSLRKGYTSFLARIIESALDNPTLTEKLIGK